MASYMDLSNQFQNLRISSHNRSRKNKKYNAEYFPNAVKVKVYSDRSPTRYFWLKHPNQIELNWSINLTPGTKQYKAVANPIRNYIDCPIEIHNIFKISNKFLERQYQLKKDYKEWDLEKECDEFTLYHFTVEENVNAIIENNFNWRMSGLSRGHKYGYGISFSPDPDFAEQFCENEDFMVVFVVKVLVSSTQIGKPHMILPEQGDTTVSPKKSVYVKFEDSEFIPEYLVYYERLE